MRIQKYRKKYMIDISTTCISDQTRVLALTAFHILYTTPYRIIVKWILDGVLNNKVEYVVNTLLYLSYVLNLISERLAEEKRSVLKVLVSTVKSLRTWRVDKCCFCEARGLFWTLFTLHFFLTTGQYVHLQQTLQSHAVLRFKNQIVYEFIVV